MDLNPDRGPRFKTKITVLPFIIFLFLCLFAGFTYFLQAKNSTLFEANVSEPTITSGKKPGVLPAVSQVEKVSAHPQIMEINRKTSSLKMPVADFLKAYELSTHENLFFTALKTGRFQQASETIFSKTGYQLICLEQISDQVKSKYGVLSYPKAATGKTVYFLFWKPAFTLKKFYYSYRGSEIQKLQKELVKINLYQYHLDGIVGKKLMRAVVHFQKQIALPVTGYPDEKTIFLLCHYEEVNRV